MEMPWSIIACNKFLATQTNCIVAQTMLFHHDPKIIGALHAPAIVLKKDVTTTAKAVGGESRWIVIEVLVNSTPQIITSDHVLTSETVKAKSCRVKENTFMSIKQFSWKQIRATRKRKRRTQTKHTYKTGNLHHSG